MAVYSITQYEKEIEALKKTWLDFADANILQIQQAARKLAAGPAPPLIQKVHLPKPPEDDAVQSLVEAINGLEQSKTDYVRPPLADVDAEWVSGKESTDAGPVIFYVHGGGSLYGSVGTARRMTRRLAHLSKGRCFAVQYRYCTDQPFPGPLLDVFVAYLSLLSPASGAKETATSPTRIVFAGESAGFSMLLALIQVLLYQRERGRTIRFHGRDVQMELPCGITGVSGLLDITGGLPSWTHDIQWDCLQETQSSYTYEWKDQELWPSDPPRADVYCERSAMIHPLVSPVAAMSWKGCPPLFIACGEERCKDGNFYVAQLAARQGVQVYLKHYEKMCHVWPTVLPKLPHSDHLLNAWAAQCRTMSEGQASHTKMDYITFGTLEARECDIENCISLTREVVITMMVKAQQSRPLIRRMDRGARI